MTKRWTKGWQKRVTSIEWPIRKLKISSKAKMEQFLIIKKKYLQEGFEFSAQIWLVDIAENFFGNFQHFKNKKKWDFKTLWVLKTAVKEKLASMDCLIGKFWPQKPAFYRTKRAFQTKQCIFYRKLNFKMRASTLIDTFWDRHSAWYLEIKSGLQFDVSISLVLVSRKRTRRWSFGFCFQDFQ